MFEGMRSTTNANTGKPMSWSDAKEEASKLMKELREKYPLTYVEMIVNALKRELRAAKSDEKKSNEEKKEDD